MLGIGLRRSRLPERLFGARRRAAITRTERLLEAVIAHDLKEGFDLGTRLLVFDKVRHDPQTPDAYGARITCDIPLRRRAAASRPQLALAG